MTLKERKQLVRSYMGKTVNIKIDRPIGYVHKKDNYSIAYPVNYGYIPGATGGDGEELDVYLLGVSEPVQVYTAKIIGIIHRENDDEDKLVAAPDSVTFSKEQIEKTVAFQEKYYTSYIETEADITTVEFNEGRFIKLPKEFDESFDYSFVTMMGDDKLVLYTEAEIDKFIKTLRGRDNERLVLRVFFTKFFPIESVSGLEKFISERFKKQIKEKGFLKIRFGIENEHMTVRILQ